MISFSSLRAPCITIKLISTFLQLTQKKNNWIFFSVFMALSNCRRAADEAARFSTTMGLFLAMAAGSRCVKTAKSNGNGLVVCMICMDYVDLRVFFFYNSKIHIDWIWLYGHIEVASKCLA